MLRQLRRRYQGLRGAPLAQFSITVTAVSPYPEEPEDNEAYRPSLIVAAEPGDDAAAPAPGTLMVATLLFVEWAQHQLGTETLPARLRALVPRLRLTVEGGRAGPAQRERHRAAQRERYFHHREAAVYAITLHRDDAGLFVAVKARVQSGRWSGEATLLEAATLAPYEALLRLEAEAGLSLLAWLARAVEAWRAGTRADFPVATWDLAAPLAPPAEA